MTDFLSDAESPEGYVPEVKPRGGRLSPTAADLKRMAQDREPTKLYVLGDEIPAQMRNRQPPEMPMMGRVHKAESVAGIEAIISQREKRARKKRIENVDGNRHLKILREMQAIKEARAAARAPAPEPVADAAPTEKVKSDEQPKKPARSKAKPSSGRAKVAHEGAAARSVK